MSLGGSFRPSPDRDLPPIHTDLHDLAGLGIDDDGRDVGTVSALVPAFEADNPVWLRAYSAAKDPDLLLIRHVLNLLPGDRQGFFLAEVDSL